MVVTYMSYNADATASTSCSVTYSNSTTNSTTDGTDWSSLFPSGGTCTTWRLVPASSLRQADANQRRRPASVSGVNDAVSDGCIERVPSYDEYRDGLDEIERKIHDEHLWMQQMSARAKTREREAADEKAKALLEDLFGSKLAPCGCYFIIQSLRYRCRQYRVYVGGRDKVDVYENGQRIHSLCGHVSYDEGLPAADKAIAQGLMLEANEAGFLDIANVHR